MNQKKVDGPTGKDGSNEEERETQDSECHDDAVKEIVPNKTISRIRKLTYLAYSAMQTQPRGPGTASGRRGTEVPPQPPRYYANAFPAQAPGSANMPVAYFQNPIMDFSYWAPYPSNIPPGISPGLAHLLSVDCVLVMQQVNMMELYISLDQTCSFMVLNTEGLCIFYAYETSAPLTRYCCGENRPFQIHVKDMYQNEVIYMSRKCSCSRCPCCFQCCCLTAMEVYSMPYTPIGAIIGHNTPSNILLDILDEDENVLFHVYQQNGCLYIYCCFQAEFTITGLDSNETEVGLIRKQWGGLFREFLSSADVFTLNFPQDLDVKIKALFLSAMFLIGLKRTGWVMRNVEDPETVSGHMFRMSIMTFLIPDGEGVDKTRCMKLSLVHDLAECIIGDITPYCGVAVSEKQRREDAAMKKLTQLIGDSGLEIYRLYKEYEAQVTEESKLVKDLDRLDMILQAYEYEKSSNKPGKLEEFFSSTMNKFHYPWTIDIVKELYRQRSNHKEGNEV